MASETQQQPEREPYAEVFRRAPDVMCIVRVSDATIFAINDAFEQASGYTREHIIGRSSREFPWWPSAAECARVLDCLREQGYLHEMETRFATPDGEQTYLISATPIIYRGERCVVWRASNITPQRRAEQTNRALEERLLQKRNLERLGLLAGGIAHDFNNLLVGVLGNADLALNIVSEDAPLRAPLRAIVTSAQRMAEHTRELLDYAGHTAMKLLSVQLDTLLDEAAEHARPLLRPGVEVQVQRHIAGAVWIAGNDGQLTRMFVNLIKNAADAMEDRPGLVCVSISRSGEEAEISFRDSGAGMDEATRGRMFDPFYSTKLRGRGLGLASVPGIVERHAGSICVESELGRGTNIIIRLPTQESAAPRPPSVPPEQFWRGRVLLVDDEAEVRAVGRAMLASFGFEVIEAEEGEVAVALMQRDPDCCMLALLDATMPGLNGAQTLERLRALQPELPILLCSGYSRADFSKVLEQPRTAFLTKPFRARQLASAIESLLWDDGQAGAGTAAESTEAAPVLTRGGDLDAC